MLKQSASLVLILSSVISTNFKPQALLYAQTAPPATVKQGTKTREALVLLRQAKRNTLRIKDRFQQDALLDRIGVAQVKAGDLETAIDTANAADFPASETLDEIATQLARTNDLTRARALGAKLKGGLTHLYTYLVEAQAREGQVASALQTAELISNAELRSYALDGIVARQVRDGDDAGARKTLQRSRELHPAGKLDADDLEMMILARDFSKTKTSEVRAKIDALKSPDERFFLRLGFAEELWKKGARDEANQLLAAAFKDLPAGSESDFIRYFAIPYQVKLGQKDAAMLAAGALPPEMSVKGYMAVAVTCAETKDIAGVEAAVAKMKSAAQADNKGSGDFGRKLMTINVASALIDNGQLREADRLLSSLEAESDYESDKFSIEPKIQLQRVAILAQENQFAAARLLALKIRPDSISDVERGTALRMTALLQTRKSGTSHSRPWSRALVNGKDQAYALLGIAQALLEIDEVKLGYGVIMVH